MTGPTNRVARKRLLTFVLSFTIVTAFPLDAQTAISADGTVESTSGGLSFPDGTFQMTAASVPAAPIADTGQKGCWNGAGTEINCAGTGQDGEFQAGVDWASPRFHVNGDGTVTDRLTGLLWLGQADCFGASTWEQALAHAGGLTAGFCGLTDGSVAGDWRLPNIKELMSLVDFRVADPALPQGHPFSSLAQRYWSSTSYLVNPSRAWYLSVEDGRITWTDKIAPPVFPRAWPVRGEIP